MRRTLHPVAALLHPLWLLALALLLVNDHLLKGSGRAPGWLTGKLSDFAIFLIFPMLLAAIVRVRTRAGAALCHGVAALLLLLLELSPRFVQAWERLLGTRTWADPWDLLALASIAASWALLVPAAAAPPRLPRIGRLLGAAGAVACLADSPAGVGGRKSTPPSFGAVVQQDVPPPPLSGGTLIVLRDGRTAVAADPDRDLVSIVDLGSMYVRATVTLDPADEPGRLVEDGAGRVHVALRNGGALVSIDVATGRVLARRTVCHAPRGVAFEAARDQLHVACAGGELVTFPAAGGEPTRSLRLDPDLRDVIVDGDRLLVSRFKTAELLVVAADGSVGERLRPETFRDRNARDGEPFEPAVAWRTIQMPSGGALMVHQRALASSVSIVHGSRSGGSSYGGTTGSDAIVHSTVTRLAVGGVQIQPSPVLPSAVLPVDLALSADGKKLAVVAAGNAFARGENGGSQFTAPRFFEVSTGNFVGGFPSGHDALVEGQPTAVAYLPDGRAVVQMRQPALLQIVGGSVVVLSSIDRGDTGHDIFHSNAGEDLACASCHPEGGEDGRPWQFEEHGVRRTQSLRGGVLIAPPFHWDGDMPSFPTLVSEVFVERMGGPKLSDEYTVALGQWVNTIPFSAPSPARDDAAASRGRAIFESPEAGCATCHSGPRLTNGEFADVGTGRPFKVPSLRGIALRAPFLHTGCAPTLKDRFDRECGGIAHGGAAALDGPALADLIVYLETL